MSGIVLLVDDDPAILRAVGAYLTKSGYEVLQAATGEQALATHQRQPVDVVLLDLNLPGLAGFEVLDRLKKNGASVVVMTGQSDIPTAVAAMKRGAENFLTKPVDMDHLSVVVGRVCDAVKMRRDTELLMSRANPDVDVRSLGSSPVMLEVVKQIELLAKSDDTTGLIIGDSGTGKGYIARMIHALSARSAGPFVEVNCGNLHADYLDEELFGVERSAQPGIRDQKPGLFELADGGTVVLDAIGNLDEMLQPKLLSVLESKTFRRVGGAKSVNVDVRVTAVSSTELISAVEEGDFRDDLYYRLNVLPIRLPAVRQRTREDRRALLEQLLIQTWSGAKEDAPKFDSSAMERVLGYDWPGNVREMRNVIERALMLSGGKTIRLEHLPMEARRNVTSGDAVFEMEPLREMERRHITLALRHHQGNRTRTARDLGISRATLIKKIKEFELDL